MRPPPAHLLVAAGAPGLGAVTADAAPGGAVLDSFAHLERKRAAAPETGSHGLRGDEAGKEGDERNTQLHCVCRKVLAMLAARTVKRVHLHLHLSGRKKTFSGKGV